MIGDGGITGDEPGSLLGNPRCNPNTEPARGKGKSPAFFGKPLC